MDSLTPGILALVILVILTLLEIPIGISMATVGFLGGLYFAGFDRTMDFLGLYVYSNVTSYTLSAVVLFLLMGQLVAQSGISHDLYNTANKWMGKFPASLCAVTIACCAAFAACCGSSGATSGTIGAIAIPQMERHGYDPKIIGGSVAAGGTLGILIPPSVIFVLYGFFAEQSVGKLFIAGILPGILLAVLFVVTIVIWALVSKNAAPVPTERYSWKERVYSLPGVSGVVLLFLLVIGGIFVGWFTPTEGAAVGAIGAFIIMAVKRKVNRKSLMMCLRDTVKITGMLYLIFIGAMLFQFCIAQTQLAVQLVKILEASGIGPYGVLAIVLVTLVILGIAMDEVAMVVLLIPIVAPVLETMGINLIWFGVLVVITVEMGMISPPIGMNLYVLRSIAPQISTKDLFIGVAPFIIALFICLIMLIIWPQISLFLPSVM
jgi:C4-dicarboxylate transporter DctM subunit